MSGIITNNGKSRELLKQFYSPNLILKNSFDDYENLYCFFAKIEPWDNENSPPTPTNTDFYIKQLYKNIIAFKKINSNDISPVIERIDWSSGTIYDQYSDSENMTELNSEGKLTKQFYVRNNYDQVFKCLYNGNNVNNTTGIPSTEMPIIDFNVNSSSDIIQTSDNYKWKYLFSIDYGSKIKFFDEKWIPLPVDTNRKQLNNNPIKGGEISVINVFNSGNNYVDDSGLNITTKIEILGDGYGANASAIVVDGKINDVIINNSGTNYSYATANISPQLNYSGNGAILVTSVSPIGGHGYDLISELGCNHVMITSEFNSSENGQISDNIDYRQIGLITNPQIKIGSDYIFANSYIYSLTYTILVSPGSETYLEDELVYQGLNLQESSFVGRVVNFDQNNNLLYVINNVGVLNKNELLKGSTSNNVRIVLNDIVDDILPYSGDIIYVENRKKIQRIPSGIEQFRLVLQY